jgi:2-amino-4-hydroxy-6-hydroxymethyldihydropteridine diphosphokinase
MTAYLSLGSNLGDREAHLREAIHRLNGLGRVLTVSSVYETEPVEVAEEQPWFLNCAVALETDLGPEELLEAILSLEQAMGRRRTGPKAPRTIDIDIVFYSDLVLNLPDLTVPHPALHQRRFVLEPLAEIAPALLHPVFKRSVEDILAALPAGTGRVRKYHAG